jgi:hypothetical protein
MRVRGSVPSGINKRMWRWKCAFSWYLFVVKYHMRVLGGVGWRRRGERRGHV